RLRGSRDGAARAAARPPLPTGQGRWSWRLAARARTAPRPPAPAQPAAGAAPAAGIASAGPLARLPVHGVTAAPAAGLPELDADRCVPLRLLALVVPPLALSARKRDSHSDSGLRHLSVFV